MPARKKIAGKKLQRKVSYPGVWDQFCSNTSMHGFKYIAERGIGWIERLIQSNSFISFQLWLLLEQFLSKFGVLRSKFVKTFQFLR